MSLRILLAVSISLIMSTVVTAMAYEFSITCVEDYKYSSAYGPCKVEDLKPWGKLQADKVEEWLEEKAGWSLEFRMGDSLVTKKNTLERVTRTFKG